MIFCKKLKQFYVTGENFYLAGEHIIFIDGKAATFVNNFTVAVSVMFAAFYNFYL